MSADRAGKVTFWRTQTELVKNQPRQGAVCEEAGSGRHDGTAWVARFSPRGEMIASAGADGLIRFWNGLSETLSASDGATHTVNHPFSRNDKPMQPLFTLAGHKGDVRAIAFCPKGDLLASGGDDRTLRLWDVKSRREVAVVNVDEARIYSIAFSPDGTILASAGREGNITLWDVAKRVPCNVLKDHEGAIYALAFCIDGELLSGGEDKTIRDWRVKDGKLLERLWGSSRSAVTGLVVKRDNQTIVCATKGDRIWECQGNSASSGGEDTPPLNVIAVSPDGSLAAAGGADTTIELWDVQSHKSRAVLRGHLFPIRRIAFSPDGKQLASCDGMGEAILWDLQEGQRVGTFPGDASASAQNGQEKMASPNRSREDLTLVDLNFAGNHQIRIFKGGNVHTWNPESGSTSATNVGVAATFNDATFSLDGHKLFVVNAEKRTIARFDIERNSLTQTGIKAVNRPNRAWVASSSGNLAATVLEERTNIVSILDVSGATNGEILVSGPGPVESMQFAPDDQTLVVCYQDGQVKIWDMATGMERMSLRSSRSPAVSLAFSAKGNVLAILHDNGEIRTFQTRQDSMLANLPCGVRSVRLAKVYPDGSRVLTAGDDGNLRLWNVPDGRLLAQAPVKAERLALTRDGRSVVVLNAGGSEVLDSQTLHRQNVLNRPWKAGTLSPGGNYVAICVPRRHVPQRFDRAI